MLIILIRFVIEFEEIDMKLILKLFIKGVVVFLIMGFDGLEFMRCGMVGIF